MNPQLLKVLGIPLPAYRPVIVTDFTQSLGNHSTSYRLGGKPAFAPLYPVLREIQFRADLICLDACGLDDDATAARLQMALDCCSEHGEGFLLADEAALQRTIAPHHALRKNIWAHLQLVAPVALRPASARSASAPTNLGAVYFARSHAAGIKSFKIATNIEDARAICEDWLRNRMTLRQGAEIAAYLTRPAQTVHLWETAVKEFNARQSTQSRAWNLWIEGGQFRATAPAFAIASGRISADEADQVLACSGRTPQQLVANRRTRGILRRAIAPESGWRISPDVAPAVEAAYQSALAQMNALRAGPPSTDLPDGVAVELRSYQKTGFDFLAQLSRTTRGGILADDMGLGKTLQTLIWLLWLKQSTINSQPSTPALIVCPASLLHNWHREAQKFTPNLNVLVIEGKLAQRCALWKCAAELQSAVPKRAAELQSADLPTTSRKHTYPDVVVINYALLRRDPELQKISWRAVVLDEAQFIKNPKAQVTRCAKALKAEHRLALTGTPMENRMLDLWSIVDFAQPGWLGSESDFKNEFDTGAPGARRRLSIRIRPLFLRRLKKDVAKDLPDRIEERRDCALGSAQMAFYRSELERSRRQIQQVVGEQGIQKSRMHVLAALTRLRQICCHPQLVGDDSTSGKTEALFELLEPLIEQGQKVLVFSQFVTMLELLKQECLARKIKTHLLTGETKNRQDVVNAFQADTGGAVFLLSLRAAGTGLNLTSASYVVLYDPWWNPAVEAQAIDRSHRIGQRQVVNAYRLISPGTVEERIWELQQAKAAAISDVLGEEGFARNLSRDDIDYLFGDITDAPTPSPRRESSSDGERAGVRCASIINSSQIDSSLTDDLKQYADLPLFAA